MRKNVSYEEAQELLLEAVQTVGSCRVELKDCIGRVLAEDITALENVPSFDRSPYDGYALRSEDTKMAAGERPAELKIIGEVAAGAVPGRCVGNGTAMKILTGAPIPEGADTVIKYEETEYTDSMVRIFRSLAAHSNIVREGEDVRAGQILARRGAVIDVGMIGTLAAQGFSAPEVYRRPHIALISTGNEIVEVGRPLVAGKIYNTSRYSIEAVLDKIGCVTEYLGTAGDCAEDIGKRIAGALETCDGVLLTGGVSAGDYDLTPAAMELAGVEVLARELI